MACKFVGRDLCFYNFHVCGNCWLHKLPYRPLPSPVCFVRFVPHIGATVSDAKCNVKQCHCAKMLANPFFSICRFFPGGHSSCCAPFLGQSPHSEVDLNQLNTKIWMSVKVLLTSATNRCQFTSHLIFSKNSRNILFFHLHPHHHTLSPL